MVGRRVEPIATVVRGEVVEPVALLCRVRTVAQVPLADETGSIALTTEYVGERNLTLPEPVLIIHDEVPMAVAPGQEGPAVRRAKGIAGESILEKHPLSGEAVQGARPCVGASACAEGVVAPLVGEDVQDVGLLHAASVSVTVQTPSMTQSDTD